MKKNREAKGERCVRRERAERGRTEPARLAARAHRKLRTPAAPARIPDPGRRPYLALPRGPGQRAAPRPPPSLAPGGAAPSRSKPAPRLRCRSERPRREQGSETEGAGEGGSACGGEAARAGEESPASDPPQPVPAPAATGLLGAYRCGAPPGPARRSARYRGSTAGLLFPGPGGVDPTQHLRRHTVRRGAGRALRKTWLHTLDSGEAARLPAQDLVRVTTGSSVS